MVLVGLTGLMGSGKTFVLNMFKTLGADTYIADEHAKRLMHSDEISSKIINLFGSESFIEGVLNRDYIAEIVFNNPNKLIKLNSIVHPAVQQDFEEFVMNSKAEYVVYESALLFQSSKLNHFDFILIITAPKEERIQRILKRDTTKIDAIKKRVQHQEISNADFKKANFIINNIDLEMTKSEVLRIHHTILNQSDLIKE